MFKRFVPITLVTIASLPLTAAAFGISIGGVKIDPNPFHPSVTLPGNTKVEAGPAGPSVTTDGKRIGPPPITGDPKKDIKAAKDAANSVGQTAQDIGHGVDHLFKEIDHLAKKHGKELALKGRITACTQTLCLSELYRDHELKKARAEAQKQKEQMLRDARAQMERDAKGNNLDGLKKGRQSLTEQIEQANVLKGEYEADIEGFQGFLANISSEMHIRASLRYLNRPVPAPIVNVGDLAQKLSMLLNAQPSSQAMEELEVQITARAQQLNIPVVTMNNEIMKAISDTDLQNLANKVDADLKNKVELLASLTVDKAELQSQLDTTNAEIKKHEGK